MKKFIAKGMPVKAAKPTEGVRSRLGVALADMQVKGAEKTAARGGNAKPSHKIYPHLD